MTEKVIRDFHGDNVFRDGDGKMWIDTDVLNEISESLRLIKASAWEEGHQATYNPDGTRKVWVTNPYKSQED